MRFPLSAAPGTKTEDFCLHVLDADGKYVKVMDLIREVNRGRVGHQGCQACLTLMKELNALTGRKFKGSDKTLAMLHARHDGYGFEAVSKTMVWRWSRVVGTEFEWTMRPETLFNATKFDGYQAMAQTEKQGPDKDGWISRRSK